MLTPFERKPTWIEITRYEHNHGGEGWELGTCLWCPRLAKNGTERYAIMRSLQKGDRVIHFLKTKYQRRRKDSYIVGMSRVKKPVYEVKREPPSAGGWAGHELYYRVDLEMYEPFPSPVPMASLFELYGNDIRREKVEQKPKFYPITTYGTGLRLSQGMYVARCTTNLLSILSQALAIGLDEDTSVTDTAGDEFSEGLRKSREVYFFERNPKLVKAAKASLGSTCQACGFNFGQVYGQLGENYIECHHKVPLSERSENEWTSALTTNVTSVNVLCANCHRMIHRQKPALTLSQLKSAIRST